MKFHYAGKYSGNPDDIPCLEHEPGAVQFKEAEDPKQLSMIMTVLSVVIFIFFFILSCIRARDVVFSYAGVFLYLLTIVPHEFLHAICFKDDVYMFQDLKHGMLFMAGPERMSKGHFIFKSLLPSIVLGFIPFIIFWINPKLVVLATLGTLGIASAAGDFYNVRNTLRQVPNGARVYQHKYNTYWYMPEKA